MTFMRSKSVSFLNLFATGPLNRILYNQGVTRTETVEDLELYVQKGHIKLLA